MTRTVLRDYQAIGVGNVLAGWNRLDRGQHPAVVWPTGAGKTVGFAELARIWLALNPGRRVLVIAHRIELIESAADKLRRATGMPVGIVKGQRNETNGLIVVASVQTLGGARGEARRRMIRDVGLIIIDECHHATAPTYRALLAHWPEALVVGFTATMVRSDRAALGDVWAEVVHTVPIAELIRLGYLVRPRGIAVHVDDLDLSRVRQTAGDFRQGELGEAIEHSLAPAAIAKAIAEHARDRPTLVFVPTVDSAYVVAAAVRDAGFTVEVVHGETHPDARKSIVVDYSGRRIQVLVNVGVFTEGTDLPLTSCIVVARPTKSEGLFVQMAGRGLRVYCEVHSNVDQCHGGMACPGRAIKPDCLILDVVGATRKLGLASPIVLFGDDVAAARELADLDELDEREPDALDLLDLDLTGGEAAEQKPDGPGGKDGPLVFTEVDLFKESALAWHRTVDGVPFLAAGHRYVTVLHSLAPGLFDVLTMDQTVLGTGVYVARGIVGMGEAMRLAEAQVTREEISHVRRKGSSRYRMPTRAQLVLAERLRLPVHSGIRHGELSDLLTVHFASRRMDTRIAGWAKGRA